MSSKQKLALIILWVGTAAAIAIGYFAGTAPVPSGTFIAVGLTAFVGRKRGQTLQFAL